MELAISAPPRSGTGHFRAARGSSAVWWVSVCVLLYFPVWVLVLFLGGSDAEPAPTPAEHWEAITAVTTIILLGVVIQLCAFAAWQLRTYGNLITFGTAPLGRSRTAIAVAWLIPVVNIVVSARVLQDLWRGSAREASSNPAWRTLRVPTSLTAWWLTYCTAIAGALAVLLVLRPNDFEHLSWRHWLAYADIAVLFFAARAGRRVMLAINDRHGRRAFELGLVPHPPALTAMNDATTVDAETFDLSRLGLFALLGPSDGDGDDGDDGDDGGDGD